jgi:hypothetical protein
MGEAVESIGIVGGVIEKNDRRLVWFLTHDGVFTLPPGEDVMHAKVRESLEQRTEISFTYDERLTLLSIR